MQKKHAPVVFYGSTVYACHRFVGMGPCNYLASSNAKNMSYVNEKNKLAAAGSCDFFPPSNLCASL